MTPAQVAPLGPGLVLGRGARATEALLLAELDRLCDEARADLSLLAKPVRVLVSSNTLREHVSARLVRRAGRTGAVAGVIVQTHHSLAIEVLRATGEAPPKGDGLFPVLVRRLARLEAPLYAVLDGLEDGYASVVGVCSDLLDAGFDPDVEAHVQAFEGALQEGDMDSGVAARARALLRVAALARGELRAQGLGRRSDALFHAADRLATRPELLSARAVLVHGFSDLTGAAQRLIEELMRRPDATLLLDAPPDPARPDREDPGSTFTERMRRDLGTPRGGGGRVPAPPQLAGTRAIGTDAEVRAAADRIHGLIAAGVAEDQIAIVARDLRDYVIPLRTHLGRLGIAFFAGPGVVAPPAGGARRVHALLDFLTDRDRTRTDRWLDLLGGLDRRRLSDLRLGLHALGTARVRDIADVDVTLHLDDYDALPLPARRGLAAAREGADGDVGPRARRRRLSGDTLREVIQRAQAACDLLEESPGWAPLDSQLQWLRALLEGPLDWKRGAMRRELDSVLSGLSAELGHVEVDFEELVLLLRRSLRDFGASSLGGAGAGVRVLSVTMARACTFSHLFLLGLNRDRFPRSPVEDPLLPDRPRRRLEEVLANIPVKARSADEEQYLFAQLASSAEAVTLSWQVADDDGKARSVSPFVERLRIGDVAFEESAAPSLHAPPDRAAGLPRTAVEAAAIAGIYAAPRSFREVFALAAREREEWDAASGPRVGAEDLAAGRHAVLRELSGPPEAGLGPYFGFVGPAVDPADLRRAPLYVTRVEGMIRCPWQLFLTRLLGLEPPPNALDALPELTPLLVGAAVHAVLEQIACGAGGGVGGALEEIEPGSARALAWPDAASLDRTLEESAAALLAREGIGPKGFARALVEAVRPLVHAARALDWPAAGAEARFLGAELEGAVNVPDASDGARSICFRADRVDLADDGLRLIDYKTGKPPSPVRGDTREALLRRVRTGQLLQAAAYAFAGGGEGRFLFLKGEGRDRSVFPVSADDEEMRAAFEGTLAVALEAFDLGAFVPRLVDPGDSAPAEPCQWCDVREACLQGDAGARARLRGWSEGEGGDAAERAARRVFERRYEVRA